MSAREVVEKYFSAIHGGGWESYIADDFTFVSSNLDKVAHGKAAYVEGAGRFFRLTTSVKVTQLIVDGNSACALARYHLRSPKGNQGVCDVAEILTVSGEKINSSKIFFDTKALQDFVAQG
ncbi:MAG TPA: nuclear transport factor 2 family protein [Terriglobales bacterium]|nr:nuclear transport factor 2 family protein [Terriglobales bacterium]